MESIDKFVQCCIKPKYYDTSNGTEYGIGYGCGSAVGFAYECTGYGEFYDCTYNDTEGDGDACGYGYPGNIGYCDFSTDNLYGEYR